MPETGVLIIGGGASGLSTAGALNQAGMGSTILDSGENIGQSWEQRYERLHLHTIRSFSGMAHFPIPHTYPKYLSKDQYASYLREYAAHFDLNIKSGTLVKRVRQSRWDGSAGWVAETGDETWHARVVVVATGQFGQPFHPDWPGLAQFGGITLHSSKFHTGRAFQHQRVLVIGAGNSGMEIVTDLIEQGASKVCISIRTGPPVVPRDFLGIPVQMFGILMDAFPPALSDKVGEALSRLALGNLHRYGLPSQGWHPFASHRTPVIDVGFVSKIKEGKVNVRPAVRSFTSTGVMYQDNYEEPFDAVIHATGFQTGLKQLLEQDRLVDQYGIPCFPSGTPTAYPGLYFMGYFDSLRGFLYESNLASRRLAQVIKSNS